MKLANASFLSFVASLVTGFLIFIGIPWAWFFVAGSENDSFLDSDSRFFFGVLYIIYVAIQLVLSIVNMVQARYLLKKDQLDIIGKNALSRFLVAGAILYIIVFFTFAWVEYLTQEVFIFCFSIPYVICCTFSIFIFRRLLKKVAVKGVAENGVH